MAFFVTACGKKEPHHDGDGHDHDKAKSTQVDDAAHPLKTCVVSGEELGAMDEVVTIDYQGTRVKFCCPDCVPKFKKNPGKYLSKLK